MIETAGPPFAQGASQGRELRPAVRARIQQVRAHHGWLGWLEACERIGVGPGRRWRRFLPQQHERLEGIARGAGCGVRALRLCDAGLALPAVASRSGARLEARFALPPEVRACLLLRTSRPEAVGFASAELALPWSVGALAGVNAAGVAVAVLAELGGSSQIPLRVLAQDVLLRAADLEGAFDHLRQRVRYAGGAGALALLDARGDGAHVRVAQGALEASPLRQEPAAPAETDVWLDADRRELAAFPGSPRAERASMASG